MGTSAAAIRPCEGPVPSEDPTRSSRRATPTVGFISLTPTRGPVEEGSYPLDAPATAIAPPRSGFDAFGKLTALRGWFQKQKS